MKNINILVTSIGGPVAQGILKGLNELDNVRIIGADRRLITAGNLFCDRVYQIPRFTEVESYFNRITELIEKETIDVLFPGHPSETELYQEYKTQLDIPVALPNSPFYEDLLDKEAVYKIMEKAGLSKYVPKYIGFTKNEDFLPLKKEYFPDESHIVVKNVKGYGALGFAIVTDEQNFLEAFKKGQRKIVSTEIYLKITDDSRRIMMEPLDKPEYSVDVFVYESKVVVAVPRKREGVSSGLVLDGTVEKEAELLQAADDIAGKLIDNGFFNMQFMKRDNSYKLTDINPRFCGSQVMSLGAGVNFPKLLLDYAVNQNYSKPEPIWGTRMIRYRDTYFVNPEENITEEKFKRDSKYQKEHY